VFLAAIAATAVTAAAFAGRAPRPDCRLARAAVEQMWRPGTRDAIAASFARTHRSHARDTAVRVAAEIDHRVTTLAGAREASCAATYERGEQSPDALDRRVACLDRQAGQLAALLDMFAAHADDDVVDHAYEATVTLPDPESCTGATQPLPAPRIRAQVAVLEGRRAGAAALYTAGHPLQARTLLDALAGEARAVGVPPLVAAVEQDRARATDKANDFAAATAAYQSAAQAAAAAADDVLIADAWLGLLNSLSDAGKSREAFDRLGFAEVAVARAGGPRLQEELLFTRGAIEAEITMLPQAKADLEAARARLSARGQAHSLEDARIEDLLATVVSKQGDNATSLALHRDALATLTRLLGEDHLTIAIELNNLAMRLDTAGESDEADRMLRRSLAIKERTFEPDNPSIAMTLHNLGGVASSRGDTSEAIAFTERALGIRERALGRDHPLVASSLANLSALYRIMGRPADALAAGQRALEIRERRSGADDPSLVFPLNKIVAALIDLGRAAQAEPLAVRARTIAERSLGAKASRTGIAWVVIADVATALRRPAAACAAYDRAAAILDDSRSSDYKYVYEPLIGQAECALAAGDLVRARTAADRALAILESTHQPRYHTGRARQVRAQVLWATPATRSVARDEASQAIAAYDGAPPIAAQDRARARNWLAAHPAP
jgi:serine/threonine-protein kinase